MSLRNFRISVQIAVADMARARSFYEGKLGLQRQGGQHAGYECGDGTRLYLYESTSHAGRSTATVARWDVDDLERVVAELVANGVQFEHYDEPVKTDSRGIHDSGYGQVAWFKDPDGNTFALEQC